MKSSNYLIVYLNQNSDVNYFGFSLMDKKSADKYMKCVRKLSDASYDHYAANTSIPYCTDDFNVIKISENEAGFLDKIFDMIEESETIGIFPDAINDAYDAGLEE